MTEPDEALLWAREQAKQLREAPNDPTRDLSAEIDVGMHDDELSDTAHAYRAGAAASAERIKELEAENAALQDLAGRLRVEMSDMLTRLEERYPEDFVWLKEGDEPTDEARALLKDPDQ